MPVGRKNHLQVMHEISVELTPASPLQGLIGYLPPGAIIQSQDIVVFTAFNSTTTLVLAGTTPGGNDLVGGVTLQTVAHLPGVTAFPGCGPYPNGTPVYYSLTVTGPAPTQGRAVYSFSYLPGAG